METNGCDGICGELGMILYGKGEKQKQIINWGKNNQLTYGKIRQLYGSSQSIVEIEKLENLGFIAIDESTIKDYELVASTRIMWLVENDDESIFYN